MAKSGSESSISEACDDSVKETSKRFEAEREDCSDKDENSITRKDVLDVPMANMSKRGSLTSAKSLHELKREPLLESIDSSADSSTDKNTVGNGDDATTTKGIRPSKSETSITDSFVVIDGEYSKRKHCQNYLREGKQRFRKQLIRFNRKESIFFLFRSIQDLNGSVNWCFVQN